MNVIKLIRYRFFLFAGLLPFLVGQATAFHRLGNLNGLRFYLGFTGILLVLIAVELFNEASRRPRKTTIIPTYFVLQ